MTILEEESKAVKKEKRSCLPQLRALSAHLTELESDMAIFWQMNPAMLALIRGNSVERSNPAWYALLGYSEYELRKTSIEKLIHPKDLSTYREHLRLLKETNNPVTFVIKCWHNTEEQWQHIKWSVSYDNDSDTLFATLWSLVSVCIGCPFNKK